MKISQIKINKKTQIAEHQQLSVFYPKVKEFTRVPLRGNNWKDSFYAWLDNL